MTVALTLSYELSFLSFLSPKILVLLDQGHYNANSKLTAFEALGEVKSIKDSNQHHLSWLIHPNNDNAGKSRKALADSDENFMVAVLRIFRQNGFTFVLFSPSLSFLSFRTATELFPARSAESNPLLSS